MMFPKPPKHTKSKREKDTAHLRFITSIPCVTCGKMPVQQHHLLKGVKRGIAMKAGDRFSLPLCAHCHDALHRNGNETKFMNEHHIYDPVSLALQLYDLGKQKDYETAESLILRRFM